MLLRFCCQEGYLPRSFPSDQARNIEHMLDFVYLSIWLIWRLCADEWIRILINDHP